MRLTTAKQLLIVLIVLLLASLACSSGTPSAPPAATSASGPTSAPAKASPMPDTATNTPAPIATKPSEPTATSKPVDEENYLGEAVEQDGYSLTAMAVQDPAKPGMFYQAENDKKLVAVEIILSNISGDSLSINPLGATLVDSEGFTYPLELAGVDDQLATLDLKKGEKVRGLVAFQTPESAVPSKIKYSIGLFGGTVLVASLALPPEGHATSASPTDAAPAQVETYLGDAAIYQGYFLSGVNIADPATPSSFYQSKADTKLVGIEMIIGNVNGDPLSVNPLSTILVDDAGFTYQAELGGMDEQIPALVIQPGEKVRGWIAYQIPTNAKPAAIKYAPDIWGDTFKAGLTPPPAEHVASTAPASSTNQALPKLGEPAKDASLSLTATDVKDPASPGMFVKLKSGMKIVGVEIVVENLAAESLSINPLYAVLVDQDGFVYEAELGGMDDQLSTMDLAQGEKIKGWVAFMVPEIAVPFAVKYGDTFTGNMVATGLSK